jgi:GT2 family glycosyltransferase
MEAYESTEVTVIIVNYNTCQDLHRCLESIYNSPPGFGFKVIVVDNHSTDGSVKMLKERFPQVHLIEYYRQSWRT